LGITKTAKNARAATIVVVSLIAGMLAMPAATQTGQLNDRDDVLRHLDAVIRWYKDSTTKIKAGQEPSDTIYVTNAQNLGAQAVRLAFQSARAEVTLDLQSSSGTNPANQDQPGSAGASPQRYALMEGEVSQRIADDQNQIEALKKQIGSASKKNRDALVQQEQGLEGRLALHKATLDAVEKMKNFVENTNTGGTGLEGSINDLARSVPEVFGTLGSPKNSTPVSTVPPAVTAAPAKTQSSSGLIGELMMLYAQMENIRSADQLLDETENVRKIASDLREPLRKQLLATLQSGKDLSNQTGVPKQQYDALTARFNQLSTALLPLSQEIVVLDQSRSNLLEWKRSLANESADMLRALIFRVLGIAIALGAILGLAEAWRRLTFRYVRDPRRRRQFLLLRRFVMGFLIGVVLILGFVSEFSSLATFAGFVTAGIAVGLQTVLLSVAAYFFVIGRYGIRVGDRITVAGVTGDVIDVGLVRLYIMELAGTGVDLYSSGRIAVFSNSVLFQATTPLFKQLPGTQYMWHEVVLPLAPGADYGPLQKTILGTVEAVYKDSKLMPGAYQPELEHDMEIMVTAPTPHQQLQFADSGLELVVRYPVDLRRASEVDDKITRALLEIIKTDKQIQSGIAGTPKIRAAVKT
jgi:small-conductance mechanosensitive channel